MGYNQTNTLKIDTSCSCGASVHIEGVDTVAKQLFDLFIETHKLCPVQKVCLKNKEK